MSLKIANNTVSQPSTLDRCAVPNRPAKTDGDGDGPGIDGFVVNPKLQAHKGASGFDTTGATGPEKALGGNPHLTNHGGAVLTKPAISNIYIGDYWKTGQGAADAKENDAMAQDFGQSKMMGIAHEFGAGSTNFLGSTVVGGKSPSRFTQSDIEKAVKQALSSGAVQKNAQGIYTVVLP